MNGCALLIPELDFGVTTIKWSPCGNMIWVGGRKQDDLVCWDVRHTRSELGRVQRKLSNNQRLSFDIDITGAVLATGSQDGRLLLYDTATFALIGTRYLPSGPSAEQAAGHAAECINSVCFHPSGSSVATVTGQRHFPVDCDSDDDKDAPVQNDTPRSGVQLWQVARKQLDE